MLLNKRKPANKSHTSRSGATRVKSSRGDKNTRQTQEMAQILSMIVQPRIGRRVGLLEPPPFQAIFPRKIKRRLRFITAVNTAFSAIDMMQLSGMMAASPTLGIPLVWAFRLKKIEIWGPVTTAGTTIITSITDVSIDTAENDFNGSFVKVVDESLSFDRPAHVWMKPAPSTPLGSWHNGQAGAIPVVLFALQGPIGSTVDIVMEVVDGFNTTPNSYTQTLVGASTGATYCHPLGGTTVSTVDGVTNV